jgi:hypothetical protein
LGVAANNATGDGEDLQEWLVDHFALVVTHRLCAGLLALAVNSPLRYGLAEGRHAVSGLPSETLIPLDALVDFRD